MVTTNKSSNSYDCSESFMKNIIQIITLGFLISCGTSTPVTEDLEPAVESTTDLINELFDEADMLSGNKAFALKIEAIEKLIQNGLVEKAQYELDRLSVTDTFEPNAILKYLLFNAQIAKVNGQDETAIQWLEDPLATDIDATSEVGKDFLLTKGQAYMTLNQPESAIFAFTKITEHWSSDTELTLYEDLWGALQNVNEQQLSSIAEDSTSYELRGWIELVRAFNSEETSIKKQLDAIDQWRRTWIRHSAAARLPQPLTELQSFWETRPTDIALILPILQPAGNAIYEGFLSAYYQELLVSQEVPKVSIYDSSNVLSITKLYNEAVSEGANLIIGPLKKSFVRELLEQGELPVDTLALNYADSLSSNNNLFQFGLAPQDEITAVIELAWKNGLRTAAILMPESEDYQELQNFFEQSWTRKGGRIASKVNFQDDASYADIVKRLMAIDTSELRSEKLLSLLPRRNMQFVPRRRNDIDFIFLVADPDAGRQIKPTLAFYFSENIPVYSIPSIYEGTQNPSGNSDLNGITFVDSPWMLRPSDIQNRSLKDNLRQATGPIQRLRAMGVDSFRIYPRLQQFSSGNISLLRGATGQILMDENQIFHRGLEAARFVDGIATLIEQ